MRLRIAVALVAHALAAIVASSPSRADPAKYRSLAAAACVPSSTMLAYVPYEVADGGYQFEANATGTLTFFCPVPVYAGSYYTWLGTDNDDDGASTAGFYVKAEFIRRSKATGTTQTLCTIYSQSPDFQGQQPCVDQYGVPKLILFDHYNDLNLVRVTVFRNAVQADSIRFLGIGYTQ
jgi:hypothetical protein